MRAVPQGITALYWAMGQSARANKPALALVSYHCRFWFLQEDQVPLLAGECSHTAPTDLHWGCFLAQELPCFRLLGTSQHPLQSPTQRHWICHYSGFLLPFCRDYEEPNGVGPRVERWWDRLGRGEGEWLHMCSHRCYVSPPGRFLSILRPWQFNTKGLFPIWLQAENFLGQTGYARTQISTEKAYLLHSPGLPFRICYFEQQLQPLSWSPLFHTWNFPQETITKFALTELFPNDLAIQVADVVSYIRGSGVLSLWGLILSWVWLSFTWEKISSF